MCAGGVKRRQARVAREDGLQLLTLSDRQLVSQLVPCLLPIAFGAAPLRWPCATRSAQLARIGCALPAPLACEHVWLGVRPIPQLHQLVWDMTCIAAIDACKCGRAAAWRLVKVDGVNFDIARNITERVARGAFWDALTVFAATTFEPADQITPALLSHPFLGMRTAHVPQRTSRMFVVYT